MQRLEVQRTRENGYRIAVDGRLADELTIDEVCGCMCSALFNEQPLFAKTLTDFLLTLSAYRRQIDPNDMLELLDMSRRTMPSQIDGPRDIPF